MNFDAKTIGAIVGILTLLGTAGSFGYGKMEDYCTLKVSEPFRYQTDSLKLKIMEITINCPQ